MPDRPSRRALKLCGLGQRLEGNGLTRTEPEQKSPFVLLCQLRAIAVAQVQGTLQVHGKIEPIN